MTRPAVRAALVLLVAGCGASPPIPAEDLAVRVTAGAAEAELGKAFPLTVVRVWSAELVPAEWDDRSLAPLTVRLVGAVRRDDGRHVEETRTYRAYAFEPGEVRVPAPRFEAAPRGGTPRAVSGEPCVVHVRPALDPASPGPVELPSDPLPEPLPWRMLTAVAGAAVVAAALVARRLRGRTPQAVASAPVSTVAEEGPHVRAMQRLAALRDREPRDDDERRADHEAVVSIVRDYLTSRFGSHARESTTDELLARAAEPQRALLAQVLVPCDVVKFACGEPSPQSRARVLDAAAAFVRETSSA